MENPGLPNRSQENQITYKSKSDYKDCALFP